MSVKHTASSIASSKEESGERIAYSRLRVERKAESGELLIISDTIFQDGLSWISISYELRRISL